MQTQKLQWHTEERIVDTLIPHKKTPRKITKEQSGRLKKSLEQFNLVEVPAIDTDGINGVSHHLPTCLRLSHRPVSDTGKRCGRQVSNLLRS